MIKIGGKPQQKVLQRKITNIRSARIIRSPQSNSFEIKRDIRHPSRATIQVKELLLKANPEMNLEKFSGLKSCKMKSERIELAFGEEGSIIFTTEDGTISLFDDGCFIGSTDIFFLEGKADVILLLTGSTEKLLGERHNNISKKTVLQQLVPFLLLLIWIAVMFDKLSKEPFLSITIVLGILAILYDGVVIVGEALKIRARKEVVMDV